MPDQPAQQKVAIVGLGLIGASIGLALKEAGLTTTRIVGFDHDHGVARKAEKMGAIDEWHGKIRDVVDGAHLVIVAVPILAVRDAFQEIAPHLGQGAIVTDTASTKANVMRWAAEILPEGVNFIGGHPMAGKETAGVDNAEAALFQGKTYCICPVADTDPAAIRTITGLAHLVGAEPVYLDADEHDQYAAAVSHMPLVLSTALFSLIRTSPSWVDLGAMASSGFKDMTRLASGDPALAHGMWRTNREAMIHWIERMMAEMARYRDMLKDAQDEKLFEAFAEAQIERETFLREPPRRKPEQQAGVDSRRALLDMFVGGMAADNLRKAEKIPELLRQKTATEAEAEVGEPKRKLTLAERIADDVRRDIEKLEAKRAEKQDDKPSDDA